MKHFFLLLIVSSIANKMKYNNSTYVQEVRSFLISEIFFFTLKLIECLGIYIYMYILTLINIILNAIF